MWRRQTFTLLIEGPVVRLFRGPKEHHTRPAIDPLFRSAALSRGADVIGVVLTGMLDDGTAGLQAIKQYAGVAIVQDPNDASAPQMPLSALKHVDVDHCLPLAAIPQALIRLAESASREQVKAVDGASFVSNEQAVFLGQGDAMQELKACAAPSTFVCPDCKGSLWKMLAVDPPRYRCHTGHAFTLQTLESAQSEATDGALWGALRAIQEKRVVLLELAAACRRENDEERAKIHDRQCSELEDQGRALRAWLETAKALASSDGGLGSDEIA
jgi:two-component system chemotaxis response regulator CheB